MTIDLEAAAHRVEHLLDQLAGVDRTTAQLADELVAELVGLHTAGLERLVALVADVDPDLPGRLADDPLVAGLFSLHDLHPLPLRDRVEQALDRVRPYLASHGGGVDLVEVTEAGVVTLALRGSCDGCGASQITLETAVEDAIRDAAPEVVAVGTRAPSDPRHEHGHEPQGLIPLDSLWHRAPLPVEAMAT